MRGTGVYSFGRPIMEGHGAPYRLDMGPLAIRTAAGAIHGMPIRCFESGFEIKSTERGLIAGTVPSRNGPCPNRPRPSRAL